MEQTVDDDELKLARASNKLLEDLTAAIPRLFWTNGLATARKVRLRVKATNVATVLALVVSCQCTYKAPLMTR